MWHCGIHPFGLCILMIAPMSPSVVSPSWLPCILPTLMASIPVCHNLFYPSQASWTRISQVLQNFWIYCQISARNVQNCAGFGYRLTWACSQQLLHILTQCLSHWKISYTKFVPQSVDWIVVNIITDSCRNVVQVENCYSEFMLQSIDWSVMVITHSCEGMSPVENCYTEFIASINRLVCGEHYRFLQECPSGELLH